eukprot:COSAG05_NODE_5222_length_1232_cov_1.182701_1_plen_88_part_10
MNRPLRNTIHSKAQTVVVLAKCVPENQGVVTSIASFEVELDEVAIVVLVINVARARVSSMCITRTMVDSVGAILGVLPVADDRAASVS